MKLGELSDIRIGGTPSRKDQSYWDTDNLTDNYWVSISDLSKKFIKTTKERITDKGIRNSNVKLIPENTVLMSFKLSIGRLGITKVPVYTNEAIAAFLPKMAGLFDYNFLYYALHRLNYFEWVDTAVKGQTLNKQKLTELPILLPPLQEQRAIAAILTSVDDAIEKTEAIIEQTEKVKKGLMQQLLTKGIGHRKFKKTEIGEIPEGWNVKSLDEIGTWYGGGTPSKQKQSYWTKNKGIVWVSPKDMYDTVIIKSEDYLTEEAVVEKGLKVLPQGSILVVTRSGILRNRVPIALAGCPLTINQDLKSLVVSPEYDNEYVFYTLSELSDLIRKKCVKSGTTVESIDVPLLKEFKIPIPPIEEQKKISTIMKNYYRKLENEKSYLTGLQTLKKGLMQVLLTGKVRVKVDDTEVVNA